MIAKMGSPLGSPSLAATAQLRGRLPTQLRRCIPLYVACVIVVMVMLNLNLFFRSGKQHKELLGQSFGAPSHANLPKSSNQFPMMSATHQRADFPHKIWQTWKVDPLSFEQRDLDVARSWVSKNPDYRYEVLTDGNEMPYVEYHFGPEGFNRPDIVNFYRNVTAAIVKADLLRYMIMYAEGGIYADIDVEALKGMNKFIPERYNVKDIDMVVGVEIDEPDWKDHPILGSKSRSFCQWTFMCKPQLPVMMRLIEQIMTWLTGVANKQGVGIDAVNLDFDEIISGTGPSAFTDAILKQMNEKPLIPVSWNDFHDMDESKVVERVLVLTVEAFAAGQGHSNSGNHDARAALVKHHYHASNWPSRHPRYSHPAYGELESCNWNDDCIHEWDHNVDAFKKMSEDDQKRIIAEKEKEREDQRRREEEEERNRQREEEENARRQEEEERKRKEEEERRREEERKKEEERRKEEETKAAAAKKLA